MLRPVVVALVGLGVLSLAGCSWFGSQGGDQAALVVREGAKVRKVTFTYVASLKAIPEGAKRLELWLPMPTSGPSQTVATPRFIGAVAESVRAETTTGNKFAHFVFEGDTLKPFQITAEYDVDIAERIGDANGSMFRDPPRPRDLVGDKLAPLDGPAVAMAQEAVSGAASTLDSAQRIYRAVLGKMRYSKEGEGWGKGSTEWACSAGYGNCTDFHALFMTMARSQGIPARFTMGFPLPEERGEGEVKGYHCWAEFFVKDIGWVPVDASEADKALDKNDTARADYYFGNLTENRIAFTRGRDFDLEPKQQGPALNFFIYPYAEVDGKPFTAVEKSFRYRDR